MFKRFVNNQALLNGLKQIKRSDNDQNQIIVPIAGNQATLTPIYELSNNNFATELEEFCTNIVPQNSAIFKIAKQICAEQGNRIQEIALEVLKDSGISSTNVGNCSNSNNSIVCASKKTESPSVLMKPTSVNISTQPSCVAFEPIETKQVQFKKPKIHDKFYGTNKIFLLDEDEIVNTSTSEDVPTQYLNLDIVKQILVDIFGKLKNLVMIFLNSFGNRQNAQYENITLTSATAQSLVLVISFMIYNIVTVRSPVELHQDILLVFQDYLSRHISF